MSLGVLWHTAQYSSQSRTCTLHIYMDKRGAWHLHMQSCTGGKPTRGPACANSSGFPALLGNSIAASRLFLTLPLIMLVIRLSNKLGAIVTTRMPCRAKSRAMGSVMDTTAPLLAE